MNPEGNHSNGSGADQSRQSRSVMEWAALRPRFARSLAHSPDHFSARAFLRPPIPLYDTNGLRRGARLLVLSAKQVGQIYGSAVFLHNPNSMNKSGADGGASQPGKVWTGVRVQVRVCTERAAPNPASFSTPPLLNRTGQRRRGLDPAAFAGRPDGAAFWPADTQRLRHRRVN